MSTFHDCVDTARAEAARAERSKQRMRVTKSGKVLSLLPSNGEWLAVVQAFSSQPGCPVLSRIVPVSELKGPARRKADRWVRWLA
jgi:hypothetical protein